MGGGEGVLGTLAAHMVSCCLGSGCGPLGSGNEKENDPTSNRGRVIAGSPPRAYDRRVVMLHRTLISQKTSDTERYPRCVSAATLVRATAMGSATVRRCNFRATAVIRRLLLL